MRVKSGKGDKQIGGKERKTFMDYVGLKEVDKGCCKRSKDFLMNLRPRRRINYCELSENEFATPKTSLLRELIAINRQLRKYLKWFQCYAALNKVDETSCKNFQQFIKKLRKYKLKLLGSCYKPKQFYKQIFLDANLTDTFAANISKYTKFIKENHPGVNSTFLHPSPQLAQRIQKNLEQEAASFTLVISNLQKKNKQIESSLITRYRKIDLPDCNNNENLKHFKKQLLVRQDMDRTNSKSKRNSSSSKLKSWNRRKFPYKYHSGMELHKLGPKEDVTKKARVVIKRLKSERIFKLYVKIKRSAYEGFIQTGRYSTNQFKLSIEIFKKYYLNHLRENQRIFVHLKSLDFGNFAHRHFINSLIYYSFGYQFCPRVFRENCAQDFIKRGLEIAKNVYGLEKLNLDIFPKSFYPIWKRRNIRFIRSSVIKFKEKGHESVGLKEEMKLSVKRDVLDFHKNCKFKDFSYNLQALRNENVGVRSKGVICGKTYGKCSNKVHENVIKPNENLSSNSVAISVAQNLTTRNEDPTPVNDPNGTVNGPENILAVAIIPNEDLNSKKNSVIFGFEPNLSTSLEVQEKCLKNDGNREILSSSTEAVSQTKSPNKCENLCQLYQNFGKEIEVETAKLQNDVANQKYIFRKLDAIKEAETDKFVEILESRNNMRIKVPDLRIIKVDDVRIVDVLKISANSPEVAQENVSVDPESEQNSFMGKINVIEGSKAENVDVVQRVGFNCETREKTKENVDFRNVSTLINQKQQEVQVPCSSARSKRNIFDAVNENVPMNPQGQNRNQRVCKTTKFNNLGPYENVFDGRNFYEINMLQKITEFFNKSVDFHFGKEHRPPRPKHNKLEILPKPQNYEAEMSNPSSHHKFPHRSNIRTEIYQTDQILNKIYDFYFDSPTLVNLNNEILQLYNYPDHQVVLSWMNHATSIIRPKFGNCLPFISHVSTLQGLVYVKHQSLQEENLSFPYIIALAPALTHMILELLTNPHSHLQEHLTLAIDISPETTSSQIACYTQFIFNYLYNYKYRCTVLGRNPSVNPSRKPKEKGNRINVLSNIRISPSKRKGEELGESGFGDKFNRDLVELWKNSEGENFGRETSRSSAKNVVSFLYWNAKDGMMINWGFLKDRKKSWENSKSSEPPTYEQHMMGNYGKRRQRLFGENEMFRQQNFNVRRNVCFEQDVVCRNQNYVQNLTAFPQTANYFTPNINTNVNQVPDKLPNCIEIYNNSSNYNQNPPTSSSSNQGLNISEIRENLSPKESQIQLSVEDVVEIIRKVEKSIDEWMSVDEKHGRREKSSPEKSNSNKTEIVNRRKAKVPKKIVAENPLPKEFIKVAGALYNILQKVPEEVRKEIRNLNSAQLCQLLQESYESANDLDQENLHRIENDPVDTPKIETQNSKRILDKLLPCFRKVTRTDEESTGRKSVAENEVVEVQIKSNNKEKVCLKDLKEKSSVERVNSCRKVSIEDIVARCNAKLINSAEVQKEIGQTNQQGVCSNKALQEVKYIVENQNVQRQFLGDSSTKIPTICYQTIPIVAENSTNPDKQTLVDETSQKKCAPVVPNENLTFIDLTKEESPKIIVEDSSTHNTPIAVVEETLLPTDGRITCENKLQTVEVLDLAVNSEEIYSVADSIEEINEEIIYTADFPDNIITIEDSQGETSDKNVTTVSDESVIDVLTNFGENSAGECKRICNLEEEKSKDWISEIDQLKAKAAKAIAKSYNSRDEIDDFFYDNEIAIEFDDFKQFSSNLSGGKDITSIDDLVLDNLDLFMDNSTDLMIPTEPTRSSGFTLLGETSKAQNLQMEYEDISEDSNDADIKSTIDVTENIYELEDSIVQINLEKYYFIYKQSKFRLSREYLDLVCEKLNKPESVYLNCSKEERLNFHAVELANFISCGILSKQILINVSLCVYFLIVCIKCGIDLVPELQNYAKNILDVEGYRKELALLEKCVVPDIVKDFYEFINFYNYDRGMELISFEYFVDNLWNGNLLDYYLGFLHYAKLGGICK